MKYLSESFLIGILLVFSLSIDLQAQTINVSMPDTMVVNESEIILPILVGDVTGRELNSFEFTISFDSTVIAIDSVITSDFMADGYLIIPNNPASDRLVVAAAGTAPLSGSGVLLAVRARFHEAGSSEVLFESIKFEPGQPPLNLQNGAVSKAAPSNTESDPAIPAHTRVSANFPNPFSESTEFLLDLTEPAQVRVELYSIIGQQVRAFESKSYAAGPNQSYPIDAGHLPAGTYLYRLSSTGQGGVIHHTGSLTIIH